MTDTAQNVRDSSCLGKTVCVFASPSRHQPANNKTTGHHELPFNVLPVVSRQNTQLSALSSVVVRACVVAGGWRECRTSFHGRSLMLSCWSAGLSHRSCCRRLFVSGSELSDARQPVLVCNNATLSHVYSIYYLSVVLPQIRTYLYCMLGDGWDGSAFVDVTSIKHGVVCLLARFSCLYFL